MGRDPVTKKDGGATDSGPRRWKYVAGAVAAAAAVVWLALFLLMGGDFYKTVEEANAAGALSGVRVGGLVVPESVVQEGDQVRFALKGDTGAVLDIAYQGPYPERLRANERVIALGSRESGGVFEATQVLVRCPDRLFPEKVTNTMLTRSGLERLLY